ncbi:MAG: TIGR02147 family protein [Proteobacteria bacterium]|nr:TIGR02147 family protein [Pseudomonadota bacterium]
MVPPISNLDHRVVAIRDEYRRRKAANVNYSLRAFARDLGSNPGSLSQIISGKRPLTRAMASAFASRGLFDASAVDIILEQGSPDKDRTRRTILASDKFALISSWYHFTVLTLTKCFPKGISQEQIAAKISEPASIVNETCERLVRLGLLQRTSEGLLKLISPDIDTGDDIPSEAIRRFHSERLLTGRNVIERVPTEEREFSSLFFNMREDDFIKFRQELRLVLDQLVDKYSTDIGSKRFVYNMNTQVFKASNRF